jgi:hypothetical protein
LLPCSQIPWQSKSFSKTLKYESKVVAIAKLSLLFFDSFKAMVFKHCSQTTFFYGISSISPSGSGSSSPFSSP